MKHHFLKGYAINDLKSAIDNEKTAVVAKLEEKFVIYKWSAIQINSVEEIKNTDYFPKANDEFILNYKQGNDKQLFAIFKPESRAEIETKTRKEVKMLAETWCKEFSWAMKIKAKDVIDGIYKKLGRYKSHIRKGSKK